MRVMVSRNVILFLKNKTNVLLCFFAIVTVVGLYVIFLRNFMIHSVENAGLNPLYINEFTDRLMVSGLLTVINTTTCFGIMQMSVADAAAGVKWDLLVSPISRFQLELCYWITSIIVSFGYSALTFCLAEYYFSVIYKDRVSLAMMFKCFGILLFSSCMNSGLLICIIRFMRDTTSFSTFGNLYGMLCGFFAGTYLPYSMYPETLRKILFYFPPMQLTSIIRRTNLSVFIEDGRVIGTQLYQMYGVQFVKGGYVVTMREQWSYLWIAMAVVLFIMRIEYRENALGVRVKK